MFSLSFRFRIIVSIHDSVRSASWPESVVELCSTPFSACPSEISMTPTFAPWYVKAFPALSERRVSKRQRVL